MYHDVYDHGIHQGSALLRGVDSTCPNLGSDSVAISAFLNRRD